MQIQRGTSPVCSAVLSTTEKALQTGFEPAPSLLPVHIIPYRHGLHMVTVPQALDF